MSTLSRRDVLQVGATGAALAAVVASPSNAAAPAATGNSFTAVREPTPLPFKPDALKGLSERLVKSHWENNYVGAVKALNVVRGRLAQAMADPDLPAYLYGAMKREQLMRSGSVAYHDLYFGNLGGNGQADAATRTLLSKHFGTFDAWESEFRRVGNALAGGTGWVMLAWNPALKTLENSWLLDHTNGVSGSTPILVMDLYEHAFHMDYGSAAAKYIDAFMTNVNWEVVAERLKTVAA
ncbi:MAG: hypothetical protein RLZZ200_946 [Pseudomonadota bacterium]|jgi:Fe-Mn family superoxide dismutase